MIVKTAAEIAAQISELKKKGQTIGFVPTMGYLHAGHLSLVEQAKSACDTAVVSIFVNPKQFGPQEDYAKYPRDLTRDKELLSAARTDILFTPAVDEVYPPDSTVRQLRADEKLSAVACGV
ncbi:MAG: pantoate--beta-alanine ligase, partial [Candidatus Margulisbacteria bacterium]|nr:pantoate--beta-alanine ligase [Candidatus Margulisiibacteriota bacterium]